MEPVSDIWATDEGPFESRWTASHWVVRSGGCVRHHRDRLGRDRPIGCHRGSRRDRQDRQPYRPPGRLLAGSYLDRSSLVLIEVDWLRPATSGFGNPGSFNVPSLGRTVADPQFERHAGLLQELTNGGTICRFDYGPQITAIPNEQRTRAWGRVDLNLSETGNLWAEFGYARNDISRAVSPSFPVLNTPLVPANNPGNTFGEAVFFRPRPRRPGYSPTT